MRSIAIKAAVVLAIWAIAGGVLCYLSTFALVQGNRWLRIPYAIVSVAAGLLVYRVIYDDDPDSVKDHLNLLGIVAVIAVTGFYVASML